MKLRLRYQERTFDVCAAITIGRKRDCEVRLNWPTVSAHHAQVFFLNGRWMVMDLASRNGTYLNKKRLGDVPVPLQDGDVVCMDWHTFHVTLEA